jgi:Fic family protein
VGQLAGEGTRLPNPHLLIRPFLRREAVLSSRIEGTQATLGEILASEAGGDVDRNPADLREVANYVAALEYGIERLRKLPLSLRLLRELHARLLEGVRGGQATPGEFRRSQNWIGPPGSTPETASFVPPPPLEMTETLNELEKAFHDTALPPLVQVALLHYQFEAIHPFLDGNGRIGRLLITLFLVEREILPSPLLYLSAFFESHREDYYRHLRAVSEASAWSEWIAFFLQGVRTQAEDALRRAASINALLDSWRARLVDAPATALALVDLLAESPFWTIRGAAERLGVAYTTAMRAIQRLEGLGVFQPVSAGKRDRLFAARAILELLEAV